MELSKRICVSMLSRLRVCYTAAYRESSSQSVNFILNRTLSYVDALLYANIEMPLLQPERPSMMLRLGRILGEPHGGRRTVGYQIPGELGELHQLDFTNKLQARRSSSA